MYVKKKCLWQETYILFNNNNVKSRKHIPLQNSDSINKIAGSTYIFNSGSKFLKVGLICVYARNTHIDCIKPI